jgi:hypothetical protein
MQSEQKLNKGFAVYYVCFIPIDISWGDWAYKSSTCDVMYCRQRRHLYYGGQILNYYMPPSTATLPS